MSGLHLRAMDVLFAIGFAAALFHFGNLAVQGETGLVTNYKVESQKRRLTQELDALRTERAELENLTKRLSDSYLDLDLLDERARDVLGYVRPDEVVVR
ncbi:MAG: septum formation initiator family protein [Pseudomonadota bacterium]